MQPFSTIFLSFHVIFEQKKVLFVCVHFLVFDSFFFLFFLVSLLLSHLICEVQMMDM